LRFYDANIRERRRGPSLRLTVKWSWHTIAVLFVTHSAMNISPATISDIPQLCDLLELLFSQEVEFHPNRDQQSSGLRKIIENPNSGQILVLREGPLIYGMVNLLFTTSTALGGRVAILEDMVIDPAQRGNGYGSRLLQAAINLARSAQCGRITLLTDRTNKSAQKFYRRHGFTSSEMIPMRLVLTTQAKT
jgi:ribosomal protein S18 acetylase RimI-like enzyme